MPDLNWKPKGITSAQAELARATAKNAEAAQNKRIFHNEEAIAAGRKVPGLDAADRAVMRMRAAAKDRELLAQPRPLNESLEARTGRLEAEIRRLRAMIDGASISASAACNEEDATITVTVTLNWGGGGGGPPPPGP